VSLAEVETDRGLTRQAETAAARERRKAQAAASVARDLSRHPAHPINPANVEDARLADLKREQYRVIEQAKDRDGGDDGPERERPHRQRM
jgi:leucyl aminopeptidase